MVYGPVGNSFIRMKKRERRESKEEKIDNLVLFSILYNVLFLDSKGTAASAKLSGANP